MLNIDKPRLDALLAKMVDGVSKGPYDTESICIFEIKGVQVQLTVTTYQNDFMDYEPRGLVAI
jgi:hypothetical protein